MSVSSQEGDKEGLLTHSGQIDPGGDTSAHAVAHAARLGNAVQPGHLLLHSYHLAQAQHARVQRHLNPAIRLDGRQLGPSHLLAL